MVTYNISISGLSSSVQLAEDDLTKVKLTSSVDKKPYIQFSFPDKDGTFENNVAFGDDVYLSINGKNVFYGYLENFTVDWRGRKLYNCVAIGRKKDLYRYFTDYGTVYSGNTNDIASSLINDYIPTSFGYTFSFQPSSAISDTGIYIDAFYPNGRTVGDCLDDLIVMDGFHWDIDNTTIKYFQPSGISKTFTYSSTSFPHPNNLGKDINNRITYVRVIGDIGYVNQYSGYTSHSYSLLQSQTAYNIIAKKDFQYIDRVKVYGKVNSGSKTLNVYIYPVYKNIAPDATKIYDSSYSWVSTGSCTDQSFSSYDEVELVNNNGSPYIQFTFDEEKPIQSIFAYVALEDSVSGTIDSTTNYYCYFEYFDSDDSVWRLGDSQIVKSIRQLSFHSPVVTSSLRLHVTNTNSSNRDIRFYEIGMFSPGFNTTRSFVIGEPIASTSTIISNTSAEWTDWIKFSSPVDISNYNEVAIAFGGNGITTYYDLHPSYTDSALKYGMTPVANSSWTFQLSKSDIKYSAFLVGWGDKILYEASGSISRESEKIPKLIVNNNIKELNTAIAVANGILNNTSLSFNGKIIFRGDENIDLYHMISGSIEPLGIDDEFKVASYQHIIDSKNKFKTVVTVNVPEYDITSRVEKLIIQNQNATI